MGSALTLQMALPIVQVAAFYPVAQWYIRRITDGSDEPWGLAALAAVLFLFAFKRSDRVRGEVSLILPALITLLYAVSYPFVPRLVQAALAITALGMTASLLRLGRPVHIPTLGLLLLSLPVIASLQFFLGYPLRVLSATLAAPLLQMSGFDVMADGTCLRWGHRLIFVDAPCSGIRMLWAGMFLSMAAASYFELTPWRTVATAALAGVAVMVGNVMRCAALFFPEAGIVQTPAWCHDAAGLMVFGSVAAAVVSISFRLGREPSDGLGWQIPKTRGAVVYTLSCLAAAAVPWVISPQLQQNNHAGFTGWPGEFEGLPVTQLVLSERDQAFARGFPGRIGKFTDGTRSILFRWIAGETRKLHPASDCFRGIGYSVRPRPLVVDGSGKHWGGFEASSEGQTVRVRERIEDAAGGEWTDVSSWYWAATLGRTKGPWFSVVVVETDRMKN
jgi:exosortase/archaeosortase family protein